MSEYSYPIDIVEKSDDPLLYIDIFCKGEQEYTPLGIEEEDIEVYNDDYLGTAD